jgi:hypothetical protein
VVLPRHRRHAQAAQLVDGRDGPLRISGGIPDQQLKWPPRDTARLVNFANGQLEPGEQVPSRFDPAGPGQRDKGTDLDG